ncbi:MULTISPECIES: MerR family transcriptional regulator [unclassified Nocardiopsis]|uniref:MerR family transcriptional regulator n=1 Tax=unclassified Nocardiopsis TaxID=2649073 RepID=UPI00066C5344|nr:MULTISPECIES: MerR family transcriptional regulator [unclassified Nocardiopsis]MBQ1083546.1 MerR family transcriptional regulator [Nocardiopsis sp. B62]
MNYGARTVGAVAAFVGVTVRTLHHWDEIGLAGPSERSAAGYRLYTASDVARIQRVLVYRELGVSLEETAKLLEADADEAADSLVNQRDQLRARIHRLERMADALDRLAEARREGVLLPPEEQVEIFGDTWRPSWAAQAREQWGDTAQWAEFAERAADRSAEDWRRIAAGVEALHADLAQAVREGVEPGSRRADALAERHREAMSEYFDCTHSMQVILGRTNVDDPGFRSNYEAIEPGLSVWLRDAIDANARAHGVDPETAAWE